jgi:hypothetical protein
LLFASFDRLVALEYSEHRKEWETDGCPIGFFWKPPGTRFLASSARDFARGQCAVTWLFVTPKWIQTDEKARPLLSRLRWVWLSFIFLAIPAFLFANLVLVALLGR